MRIIPSFASLNASEAPVAPKNETMSVPSRFGEEEERAATAIVYCEANFGAIDGKTANGLIRRSEKYEILSVIDSEQAGLDTGMVLDNKANAIPICRDLADSLAQAGSVPDFFIFGMAPASGVLSNAFATFGSGLRVRPARLKLFLKNRLIRLICEGILCLLSLLSVS